MTALKFRITKALLDGLEDDPRPRGRRIPRPPGMEHHVAGHVVVAALTRKRVPAFDLVRIKRKWHGLLEDCGPFGGCCHCGPMAMKERPTFPVNAQTGMRALAEAAVLLGGPIAEEMHGAGSLVHLGADQNAAIDAVLSIFGRKEADLLAHARGVKRDDIILDAAGVVEAIDERVRTKLGQPRIWLAVDRVADAMRGKPRLRRATALEIVGDVLGPADVSPRERRDAMPQLALDDVLRCCPVS